MANKSRWSNHDITSLKDFLSNAEKGSRVTLYGDFGVNHGIVLAGGRLELETAYGKVSLGLEGSNQFSAGDFGNRVKEAEVLPPWTEALVIMVEGFAIWVRRRDGSFVNPLGDEADILTPHDFLEEDLAVEVVIDKDGKLPEELENLSGDNNW